MVAQHSYWYCVTRFTCTIISNLIKKHERFLEFNEKWRRQINFLPNFKFVTQKFAPDIGPNLFIISALHPCCLWAVNLKKSKRKARWSSSATIHFNPSIEERKISATFFLLLCFGKWNLLNGAWGHKRDFYAVFIFALGTLRKLCHWKYFYHQEKKIFKIY